jgi:hypothetical protein
MDDGDKQNQRKIFGKTPKVNAIQGRDFVSSTFLQSLWIRCRSIFPNTTDGKFMESELRYVLYCGIFFWMLHILWQTIK